MITPLKAGLVTGLVGGGAVGLGLERITRPDGSVPDAKAQDAWDAAFSRRFKADQQRDGGLDSERRRLVDDFVAEHPPPKGVSVSVTDSSWSVEHAAPETREDFILPVAVFGGIGSLVTGLAAATMLERTGEKLNDGRVRRFAAGALATVMLGGIIGAIGADLIGRRTSAAD